MTIIGLGQPAAGDDGVGLAVVRALRRARPEVAAVELTDAAGLVELLTGEPAVLVDAVVDAGPPGALVEIPRDRIAEVPAVSTHGVGVGEAIGLAEALNGPAAVADLRLLGVAIARPDRLSTGLSPDVAAAVPRAVRRLEAWIDA